MSIAALSRDSPLHSLTPSLSLSLFVCCSAPTLSLSSGTSPPVRQARCRAGTRPNITLLHPASQLPLVSRELLQTHILIRAHGSEKKKQKTHKHQLHFAEQGRDMMQPRERLIAYLFSSAPSLPLCPPLTFFSSPTTHRQELQNSAIQRQITQQSSSVVIPALHTSGSSAAILRCQKEQRSHDAEEGPSQRSVTNLSTKPHSQDAIQPHLGW